MARETHRARATDLEPLSFSRPLTRVDVVIFAIRDDALQVLLVQRPAEDDEPFPSMWALPGGFVDVERDHDLEACALRKLQEKTGVASPYLEQLGSWGGADRDPRGWSATHAYFALMPAERVRPRGAHAAEWRGFPSLTGRSSRSSPSITAKSWRPRSNACAARWNTPRCRPT